MDAKEVAKMLLHAAMRHGATGARAVVTGTHSYGVTVEQGNEKPEISHERSVGVVVYVGERHAAAGGSTTSRRGLDALVQKAVEMARVNMPDPHAFLAPRGLWPFNVVRRTRKLDLVDDVHTPSLKELAKMAHAVEEGALSCTGVSRTECADAAYGYEENVCMTSAGFEDAFVSTSYGIGGTAVAGTGETMVEGSESDIARHRSDLRDPSLVGRIAGERAAARLGSSSMWGGVMPVVFDALISPRIMHILVNAIGGELVYAKQTFLRDALHERIFLPDVTVFDDPEMPRMMGSHLYDCDCVATSVLKIVADGVLQTWLTDLKSASKLGIGCTGHGDVGGVGVGNVVLVNTSMSKQQLIADIARGFLVTALLGRGVDLPTGNFSLGAEGFLIENGVVGRPVDEMTIAGNMRDVFAAIRPANDRIWNWKISAPTLRVDGIMVAGKGS